MSFLLIISKPLLLKLPLSPEYQWFLLPFQILSTDKSKTLPYNSYGLGKKKIFPFITFSSSYDQTRPFHLIRKFLKIDVYSVCLPLMFSHFLFQSKLLPPPSSDTVHVKVSNPSLCSLRCSVPFPLSSDQPG